MIDLVFDARMINSSGIGTYCRAIIPEILKKYDCYFLGNVEELQKSVPDQRIISFNSEIYSIEEQFRYGKVIPECSIFWCPHYNVPFFPVRAKKRLTTIHDVFHLAFSDKLSLKQKIYSKIMFKRAVGASDKIITVSKHSKNEIIKYAGVNGDKISVIYNSIGPNLENVQYNKKTDPVIDGKYVLYVGNVKPHKNLINLIKAFQLSGLSEEGVKLVIVGKKEGFRTLDDEVLSLSNRLQNIVFTGFLSDKELEWVYRNAIFLVLPSLYEGFGYPIIEAMYYNTPVLCSDIEVFKEVAEDSAVYFDPQNPEDIKQKLVSFYQNKELQIKKVSLGVELVKSKYGYKDFIQEHLGVIDALL